MVEAGTGITDYDSEIADLLRRSKKPVILCVNKVDSGDKMYDAYQFYSLGLGDLYCISSANGSGTGDLLDAVVSALPEETEKKLLKAVKLFELCLLLVYDRGQEVKFGHNPLLL